MYFLVELLSNSETLKQIFKIKTKLFKSVSALYFFFRILGSKQIVWMFGSTNSSQNNIITMNWNCVWIWIEIPSDLMAFHTLHTLSSHTNLLGYAAKPQAASKWAKLPAKCAHTCIKKQQFLALLYRMLPESTIFPTETKNVFVSPWKWQKNTSTTQVNAI